MKYEALGKTWDIAFPFAVQRELEQRYDKGFYGVCRMITPNMRGDIDLEGNPAVILDALGDVRVGVLVAMLEAGTEGMDEETAVAAFEELSIVGAFTLIFKAINPGVEDDAPRPPVAAKKKTPKKKRAG